MTNPHASQAFSVVACTAAPAVVRRGAVQVVAAEPPAKKAAKKRTPAPVKRAMISEDRRMYNKARKSACATRIKKVRKENSANSAASAVSDSVQPWERINPAAMHLN